ncbi:MAG: cytochrome c [Deferrisomatales bacterium]|nr:cytochrome c [Deferrisomatales bacterium]
MLVRSIGVMAAVMGGALAVAGGPAAQEGRPEGRTTLSIAQREDLSERALAVLNKKCTVCHTAERFDARHFTPEQWTRVLEAMVARGASLTPEEAETLRQWREIR